MGQTTASQSVGRHIHWLVMYGAAVDPREADVDTVNELLGRLAKNL